ncbi:MAG: hypothetical protein M1814_006696 [Vezdaea aestivalis]|nr:MAG: hypothetical protein M1814_006696 [Vezdaea aestivalis]
MSTPKRRSARLATPSKTTVNAALDSKLSSLLEGDELLANEQMSNLNEILSSPIRPKPDSHRKVMPATVSQISTPNTAPRFRPSTDEMHPSKAQKSTRQKLDSGLRLGFADPQVTPNQSALSKLQTYQNTPSRSNLVFQEQTRQGSHAFESIDKELGPECRKMMQELREQAAQIKGKMLEEQERERLQGRGSSSLAQTGSPRKFAVPKGKRGRFSDVHMAQFKKMDSITNHPSAFRTQPGRFDVAKGSLKRTKSQANLDESEDKNTLSHSSITANSAKRTKKNVEGARSTIRPVSRDGPSLIPLARPQTGLMTPTKASIARSESAKHSRSMLSSITRNSSSKLISSLPRSEGSRKYLSSLSGIGRVKSLLRRPNAEPGRQIFGGLKSSDQATAKLDINKQLPSIPGTPTSGIPRSTSAKNPTYTPTKTAKHHAADAPTSTAKARPETSRGWKEGILALEQAIEYPTIPQEALSSPAPINTTRPMLTPRVRRSRPSGPGDFTFRSEKGIKFGDRNATTIRQVRPSTGPINTIYYPTLPHGIENKKRHRDDDSDNDETTGPCAKKSKGGFSTGAEKENPIRKELTTLSSPNKTVTPSKRISPVKGKGFLSLSRLNVLARPKVRRCDA